MSARKFMTSLGLGVSSALVATVALAAPTPVTEPGCEAIECTTLVVIAESEAPPLWPFIGAHPSKSLELVDGVQAHFWERGGMASLQWMQDDSLDVLSYRQAIFSPEAAIAMATSMATEPPYSP
ncbi:MAG: hypothetical protein ACFB12_26635 [Leptolyngbyaceae cyanobacterium]